MKLNEIQDLIKFVSKSGVSEVELETKEIKIVIRTPKTAAAVMQQAPVMQQLPVMAGQVAQPAVQANPVQSTGGDKAGTSGDDDSKYIVIKSPMIGTFYRSAGPDKPQFVGVGDEITLGKTVCIIEAMKLMNEIDSEFSGKVLEICLEDGQMVEYGEVIFKIEQS